MLSEANSGGRYLMDSSALGGEEGCFALKVAE